MSQRIAHAIMASDSEHWITTENGSHLLIGGEGGDYKVIGGAGGKMNGQFIGPSSMSKNVEKNSSQSKKEESSTKSASNTAKSIPSIPEGHHTIKNPLMIKKKTNNAYGVMLPNKDFPGYEEIQWIPKSHSSEHEGKLVSISPWLANKQKIKTHEGEKERQEKIQKNNKENPKSERLYLKVPFEKKDEAKKHGAKWDPESKRWYANGGELPEGLKKFSQSSGGSPPRSISEQIERKMPTSGRIGESDPSVYGYQLLGHEGELWSDYHKGKLTEHYTFTPIEAMDGSMYSEDEIKAMDEEYNNDFIIYISRVILKYIRNLM